MSQLKLEIKRLKVVIKRDITDAELYSFLTSKNLQSEE